MSQIATIVQLLTDPENQPHQYIDKPEQLAERILEIVNEIELGREWPNQPIPCERRFRAGNISSGPCRNCDPCWMNGHGTPATLE